MRFADPVLLAAGLLVAAALACAAAVAARRRAAALAAAGAVSTGGRKTGRGRARSAGTWFTVAGLAVLAVASAGPTAVVPATHASGTVIIAMDVSGSMAATDVQPSRLGAAQQVARAFISAQPPSVQIGVVAFQQGGLEAAPPSTDHSGALSAIGRLSPGGGTSLGAAILAALSAITRKAVATAPNGSAPHLGYWPSATIVLFSDGQDGGEAGPSGNGGSSTGGAGSGGGQGVSLAAATATAAQAGVHIDTVGVGTAAGTTVSVEGYHLFTGLDAATLMGIAQSTGGSYHPASSAGELNGIASSINLRLTVSHEPLPLAGAFTVLALVLLAAGALLTVARAGRVV